MFHKILHLIFRKSFTFHNFDTFIPIDPKNLLLRVVRTEIFNPILQERELFFRSLGY